MRSAKREQSATDKFEPAIYTVNIENCGDCWVTVYLDRQHGAVRGTNAELGCQYRATRALPLLRITDTTA